MGVADDLISLFFRQHPEAGLGELSLPELNKLLEDFKQKVNHAPDPDFDGLSPAQMYLLLHKPLSDNCILRFHHAMDQFVEQVPLFCLSELLLAEIRSAGALKLTAKGNLPVRTCALLYSQDLIDWAYRKYVKRVREEEIPYLWPLKHYLLDRGIVKKRDNALSLTNNGEQLMRESKTARFKKLLFFFGERFHWGNFYGLEDDGVCGQLGWAYSLVLLGEYGGQARESEFYSQHWIQAFEKDSRENLNDESMLVYHRAYAVRFFECFACWFGLAELERKNHDKLIIKKSALFERLFENQPV